ncbi:MAG TPA: hypothetical protein VIL69_20020, partial [Roseomonas sp.]
GRTEMPGGGVSRLRAREWLGCDDAGETIARVVRVHGPLFANWRLLHAVALDDEARVVELRPSLDGDRWLVVVKDRVVGRAPLALAAVRTAEEALASN